ncbi:LysR family transcriptional regulator [Williamsia sp. Leaf354]|uniref:LysR family transcriptional regulator n=1 Tax=Williamsia sp. Leaf354 TaxID=1736349 RepID=UPI000B22F444|nr:LysR family transcriptional regulator [Williamsia sp. Leaf354]
MELRQVRYFVAVLDTGSFTAAAQSLSIVQSAVSQQISRLERELGTDLFDRSRRSVRPTTAGRRFEPFARSMLDTESAARRALSPSSASGPTRIGVSTGLGALATAAAASIREGLVPSPIEVIGVPGDDRERRVSEGDLAAAIVRSPPTRPELVAFPLPADDVVVGVATGHPAASADSLTLGDLASHPLVLSVGAIGEPLCTSVIAACRRAGVEPHLQVLTPGADALSALTTVPDAWTVFLVTHARQLYAEALGVRFVRCVEPLTVPKSLIVRRDRTDVGARLAAAITELETA